MTTRALGRLLAILVSVLVAACSEPQPGSAPDGGVDGTDALPLVDGPGPAPDAGETEADRLLGRDRDAFFDEIVATLGGVQVISSVGLARLGTTWEDALAAPRKRFGAAASGLDVYYALLALQRSYHDAHSQLQVKPTAALPAPVQTPPVELPLRFRVEYPAGPTGPVDYVVASVAPAASNKVTVGSRLEAVDGKTVTELEAEWQVWQRSSSPEGLRQDLARWLAWRRAANSPAPDPGTTTRLRLAPPGTGAAGDVELSWQQSTAAPEQDPCLAAMDLPPGGGEDYATRTPQFIGINYCIYDSGAAGTKVLRWFSFFYEFSDFSGGDPYLTFAPALRERMKHMSYTIPDNQLPFYPGEALPDGMLDPVALALIDLDKALAHLATKGVTRLLVDVRENGGGNFHPAWLAPFATQPFQQLATQFIYGDGIKADPALLDHAASPHAGRAKAYLLQNPTAAASPEYPFICQSALCGANDMTVAPAPAPLSAEVVVLTGPGCVSSCDNFAAMMKDSGLAKLAGMPSCGADSPARLPLEVTLKNGTEVVTFVLTVAVNRRSDGAILEGAPPAPDYPVYPSAATRGKYVEAVLQAVGW